MPITKIIFISILLRPFTRLPCLLSPLDVHIFDVDRPSCHYFDIPPLPCPKASARPPMPQSRTSLRDADGTERLVSGPFSIMAHFLH